jgi:predicted NAD/FAD-binding protein
MLSCVAALCCLRLIELRLKRAGLDMTAATAMDHMRSLHSCLCLSSAGKMQAARMLEQPSPKQAAILKAFGYKVVDGALKSLKTSQAS